MNNTLEQKIFKEFEELGYKILICPTNNSRIQIVKEDNDTIIELAKLEQWYECRGYGVNIPQVIITKEHQLLHKLFELWGWFDE